MIRSKHCIYCAQQGVDTPLVPTDWGGTCPVHSADFLQRISLNRIKSDPLVQMHRDREKYRRENS